LSTRYCIGCRNNIKTSVWRVGKGVVVRKHVMLVTLMFVVGCGGDQDEFASADPFCQQVLPQVRAFIAEASARNPTPDDARYGGTVVVSSVEELADGMNAAVTAAVTSREHQKYVNLMTLVDYDENLELRPYLAESWDISDDNTSITFHLRQDVFWHDGERTDAHDVAFTYRTVTNPETGYSNPGVWDRYDSSAGGVEVIDDFTVLIRLSPHAEVMDQWTFLGILPEHLLGEVPPSELKQHPFGTQCPVGNGPFVFQSHRAQERWVFEANPLFPEALGGRPFLDRYILRILPEPATSLAELLTEGLDVHLHVAPDQAQRIVDHPTIELRDSRSRGYTMVGWNSRRPVLADSRVRQALTLGTNREEIVASVGRGYGTVANSGLSPIHWAYDANTTRTQAYDPARAGALLTDAQWIDRDGDGIRENEDGLRLAFSIKYPVGGNLNRNIVEIMQAQLAIIGVDVRPQGVELTTLIEQMTTADLRDFDGVAVGITPWFKLDETDLFHSDRMDSPLAFAGTQNPKIDDLLDRLSVTVDREEANSLWAEYQRAIAEESPIMYVAHWNRLSGVNQRLQGVEMDVRGDLVNVREWYIDPGN
jgi:peptide/nickel transport system substrate-binding protein